MCFMNMSYLLLSPGAARGNQPTVLPLMAGVPPPAPTRADPRGQQTQPVSGGTAATQEQLEQIVLGVLGRVHGAAVNGPGSHSVPGEIQLTPHVRYSYELRCGCVCGCLCDEVLITVLVATHVGMNPAHLLSHQVESSLWLPLSSGDRLKQVSAMDPVDKFISMQKLTGVTCDVDMEGGM